MTVFDLAKNVLHSTKLLDLNIEDIKSISPYMLNRVISMYSPAMCYWIDRVGNANNQSIEDYYPFIHKLIPKQPAKYSKYLKNTKKSNNSPSSEVIELANLLEISVREVELLLQTNKIL